MTAIADIDTFRDLGLVNEQQKSHSNTDLGQEDFLNLMVTQLQNQDPMNPMDSDAFLGQIAQFSTVSGIQDLQGSFSDLANSLTTAQVYESANLVGHSVLVPTTHAYMEAGQGLSGSLDLPVSAANVSVGFYDDAGVQVHRIVLGNQQAGEVRFTWDGTSDVGTPVPSGVYELRAEGNVGGDSYSIETWAEAEVESVNFSGSGSSPVLNLVELGSIAFSDVKEVR